MHENMKRYS